MGIDANVTSSQIVAAVTEGGVSVDVAGGSVSVDVSGGVGPTGPQGPGGSSALPSGTEGYVLTYVGGTWTAAAPSGAVSSVAGKTGTVTLVVADVSGLQTALDGKQAAGSYAAATHTHVIADVSGLQAALDNKSNTGHIHTAIYDNNDDSFALGYDSSNTGWEIANASGFRTAISAAAATHSHTWSDITSGVPSTFTPSAHTHTLSAITDAGTAASRNAPTSGNASSTQVVLGSDTRLSDSRNPLSHTHTTAETQTLSNATPINTLDSLVDGVANNGWAYGREIVIGAAALSHTHSPSAVTFAATDRLLGRSSTGGGAGQEITCTSAGRDLLDDANAAAQRTTLGLGTAATANTGDFATAGHTHAQLHDRSHAITSSSDHTATAWRVFYSNGSGVVTELALGSSGTVLTSNGASAAPTFSTVSGGGGSSVGSDLYLWATFR